MQLILTPSDTWSMAAAHRQRPSLAGVLARGHGILPPGVAVGRGLVVVQVVRDSSRRVGAFTWRPKDIMTPSGSRRPSLRGTRDRRSARALPAPEDAPGGRRGTVYARGSPAPFGASPAPLRAPGNRDDGQRPSRRRLCVARRLVRCLPACPRSY